MLTKRVRTALFLSLQWFPCRIGHNQTSLHCNMPSLVLHTTVFRGLDHPTHTPLTSTNILTRSSTVVTWTRGAVYFIYSFNEMQSQERGGKTSLQTHRKSPQVLLNLEIIASATEDPLQCLLLKSSSSLPYLIYYHTMSNKDSGNMGLGSQSSDGTDATATSFQNTHWFDYSKVRLLYLYLHSSWQSTEFSQRCINPPAPYPTASPFSHIQLFHCQLPFTFCNKIQPLLSLSASHLA